MNMFTNVHDRPCLCQINPTYTLEPHLFKLQYNTILQSTPVLQTVFSFTYTDENSTRISLFSHVLPHLIHADFMSYYF